MTCLAGLAVALVLVGIVSGTVLRHIVQILPIIAAAVLLKRRPDGATYAAIPVFLIWIFLVTMIWLFLLGLSRLAKGHYTTIEIVLTLFMAAFSVAGSIAAVSLGTPRRPIHRVIVFVLFAVLQIAAMWVSFLPAIANR